MYTDLTRPPLAAAPLRAALAADGFELTVVAETGSTNADLMAAARAGAPEGTVLVAERQSGGRGRLDRRWVSPPAAGLTFSVLLRPRLPASYWSSLPLLTGVAVATALREQCGVQAVLKWPNDVLVDGGKLAGILVEASYGSRGDPDPSAGPAVVVGIGLNVSTRRSEFPADARATSLLLEEATTTDRATVLKAILRALARGYAGWLADPATLPPAYRSLCSTIGRQVRVELPDGSAVTGTATGVDDEGRLLVGERAFGAGDVVHLR